jgi:recombination protein RecT
MTESKQEDKQLTTPEPSQSERFTMLLMKEFSEASGEVTVFDDKKKRLGKHLFIKADAALKEFEKNRLSKNQLSKSAYTWGNVNLTKMSLDAVHRIELGLDPLIDNHIWVIPYWNSALGKYDLDLRIGYTGEDYYKRKFALDPPKDIIYELVHENDDFTVFKKDKENKIETYSLKIIDPFERGEVVGGFGYIVYDDETKNKLVLVSEAKFLEAKKQAKSNDFWDRNPVEMRYKTLVHRTTDKILIDPDKVNDSYFNIEQQEKIEPASEGDQIIDATFEESEETTPELTAQEETPEQTEPDWMND